MKKTTNSTNVNVDKIVDLIVANILKDINLEEVITKALASSEAPATPAKAPAKYRTREEALTAAYGSKEQRKANVAGMKDCYEQSWSNWVKVRDASELNRAQKKAGNQTVSGLARKAGYAGEVLTTSFFKKLVKGSF